MKNVIVDIDGTIAKLLERDAELNVPEDWVRLFSRVSECEPNFNTIDLVEDYMWSGYRIIFCTARPEFTRDDTYRWLREYIGGPTIISLSKNDILMRSDGDYRNDGIVKLELLKGANITPENTYLCIDDSDSVHKALTSEGFKVIKVKPEYSN